MSVRWYRTSLVILLAAAMVSAPVVPAYGQQAEGQQTGGQQTTPPPAAPQPQNKAPKLNLDYTRGKHQFPNLIAPYTSTVGVPPAVLTNAPTIDQMVHDGKLEVHLQDVIALALQNNMDITVQRYTPWLAEAAILQARATSFVPGVNLDPVVTSNLFFDRRSSPINNPFLAGTGVALSAFTSHTGQYNFLYSQGFTTGTNYTIGLNNTRSSSTITANTFNPSVQSSLVLAFSQPLLNGFGFLQNRSALVIARNNKSIADLTFEQQLFTTVAAVSNSYWELVFAGEDVKVQQQSVALAQKLYEDNKRQVAIGTLAQIEVTRAEAQLASAQSALIVSQTNQLQQQILLKNLISRNPLDPMIRDIQVIPLDQAAQPNFEIVPIQDAVVEAMGKRPDVLSAKTTLLSDDVTVRASRRSLLPSLNLTGQYSMTGLGGNSVTTNSTIVAGSPIVNASGQPVAGLFLPSGRTSITGIVPGGWGDALNQIYLNSFPDYNVGISLTIPIRNRAAQAANERALLQERQDEMRLRQVQNTVIVDIRTAQIALQNGRAEVASAIQARQLAQETLDADQKRFQLGATTVFQVIQDQRDLATAQSTEIRSLINMIEAKVTFDRVMGRLLDVNNISIPDVQRGQISREQLIPGTPTPVNSDLFNFGNHKR